MKIIIIAMVVISSFLVGCNRETLDGLNIKVKGELNSDYEDSKTGNQNSSKSTSPENENQLEEKNNETPNIIKNQPVIEVNNNSNPDAPLPFYPIKDCSESGIVAETNKIFYAQNKNTKSIDSKNAEEIKKWKSIKNQVKNKCENQKQ
jgi:hypothetical protein